jgi:hypothetical protein
MKIIRIVGTLTLPVTGLLVCLAAPVTAAPSAVITAASAADGSPDGGGADIIACPLNTSGCRKTPHPGQDVFG